MNPPVTRAAEAFSEADLERLQALLDALPAPLEPLDVSMVDGYLCGVLVQPEVVPLGVWLPPILDSEGRPTPARVDDELLALLRRRHKELNVAIAGRQWFDPWVFELESEDEDEPAAPDAVYPWVAGFALAMECFPELMQRDAQALTEPLALLYRHLDPEDLEDADALIEEIETLEPPERLEEAVEDLVRATLLIADVSRPVTAPPARRAPPRSRPRR